MGFIPEPGGFSVAIAIADLTLNPSCLFVGSDPDPSLFWCNNETAVSGQSLESCKNNLPSPHSEPREVVELSST